MAKKYKELKETELEKVNGGLSKPGQETYAPGKPGQEKYYPNKPGQEEYACRPDNEKYAARLRKESKGSFNFINFFLKLFGIQTNDINTLEDIDPQDPKYTNRNMM